jgi:hypothetical protein
MKREFFKNDYQKNLALIIIDITGLEVFSRGGRIETRCINFPPGEILIFVQQLLQGGKEFDTK